MAERITKIVALIIVGCFLGYMHHFMATRSIYETMAGQINDLQAAVAILDEDVGDLTNSIVTLNQKFKVKSRFKVTGYSNDPVSINVPRWRDGKTATGITAEPGICAADWDFLPVGSLVWVDGYGWCEVQDRGGKVRGKHIDLFFPDRRQALRWGVKKMDVIIAEASR